MALEYPDVSNFQGNMTLQAGTPACIAKASEGTTYKDPYYSHFKSEAARVGALFGGYHFLHAGNASAQAANCFAAVGPGVPVMIDHESTTGSNPTVQDALDFTSSFRALGGLVVLEYLPEWYWQQLGSPSLLPITDIGLGLVSSSYPSGGYSDTGSGWDSYGGVTPVIWQYTDAQSYSGQLVDFNAFRGTLAELEALLQGGGSTMTMSWTDIIHGIGERIGGNQVNYILTDLGRFRDRLFGDTTVSVPANSPLAQIIALPAAVAALGSSLTSIGTNVTAIKSAISAITSPTVDPTALAADVKAALTDPTVMQAIAHALAIELHNDTPSS